jgi:hypothetical protein
VQKVPSTASLLPGDEGTNQGLHLTGKSGSATLTLQPWVRRQDTGTEADIESDVSIINGKLFSGQDIEHCHYNPVTEFLV